MQLIFKAPDKNTPGFARRLYRAAQFQERSKAGEFTAELMADMIDFLSDYVEGEREEAKEMLWNCTETQFTELLTAVTGGGGQEVPPQQSGA